MPELPEVATMLKAFKPHLMGRRVRHVLAEPAGLLVGGGPGDVRAALQDTVVTAVARLGKYVRIDFEPGSQRSWDRSLERAPAPTASIVATRPENLGDILGPRPTGKAGHSGPSTGRKAAGLFQATRARPKGRNARRASLILHLKMTGRFFVMKDNGLPVPPRTRILLAIEGPKDDLLFGMKDTRRLGSVQLVTGPEAHRWPESLGLGPDALSGRLTVGKLGRSLTGRVPIKLALLDQSRLAGLGNIYACEVLHRTGIHPERPAGTLTAREHAALAKEIPHLLRKSMQEWCDLSRWVGPAVEGYGDFNGSLRVYDRAGRPCRRCKDPIRTVRQGGRTTFFCGTCQK